jgi:hypothetical protein
MAELYVQGPKDGVVRIVLNEWVMGRAPRTYEVKNSKILSDILSSTAMEIPDAEKTKNGRVRRGDIFNPSEYLEIQRILERYIPSQIEDLI